MPANADRKNRAENHARHRVNIFAYAVSTTAKTTTKSSIRVGTEPHNCELWGNLTTIRQTGQVKVPLAEWLAPRRLAFDEGRQGEDRPPREGFQHAPLPPSHTRRITSSAEFTPADMKTSWKTFSPTTPHHHAPRRRPKPTLGPKPGASTKDNAPQEPWAEAKKASRRASWGRVALDGYRPSAPRSFGGRTSGAVLDSQPWIYHVGLERGTIALRARAHQLAATYARIECTGLLRD